MDIVEMNVTRGFNYLWLKSVEDIDLMSHCANCLIGEFVKEVKASTKTLENLELDNKIYYLCGVARPWNWNDNFHLAFMYSPGNVLTFEDKGIKITIQDAVILPINSDSINADHPKSKFKTYHTCRNWQFANFLNVNRELF